MPSSSLILLCICVVSQQTAMASPMEGVTTESKSNTKTKVPASVPRRHLPPRKAAPKRDFEVPMDLQCGVIHTLPEVFMELNPKQWETMTDDAKSDPANNLRYLMWVSSKSPVCTPVGPLRLVRFQPISIGDGRLVRCVEDGSYIKEQKRRGDKQINIATTVQAGLVSAKKGEEIVQLMDSRAITYAMDPDVFNVLRDCQMEHGEIRAMLLPMLPYKLEASISATGAKQYLLNYTLPENAEQVKELVRDGERQWNAFVKKGFVEKGSSGSSTASK